MGLSSTVSDATYAGNNSTVTAYPVPFRFDENSWLRVRKTVGGVTTNLALGSDFTISGIGSSTSASIKTVVAVPATGTVYIYRDTPQTNTFQPTLNGGVQSVPLEKEVDKLTMMAQEASRDGESSLGRSLRVPVGDPYPSDLPSKSARANGTLGFDGNGNPIVVSTGLITNIAAVQAASATATSAAATATTAAQSAQSAADIVSNYTRPFHLPEMAFYGDSITAYDASADGTPVPADGIGNYYLAGRGPFVWLRILMRCGFNFVPNGILLHFAIAGQSTTQLMSSQLPLLLASRAKFVIDQAGINDVGQGIPEATTVANCRSTWAQLKAKGIFVCKMKITPACLGLSGNSTGAFSAKVASLNAALRIAAAQDGVPFLEHDLETVTNNGIGVDAYFTPDPTFGVHPNPVGARKIASDILPQVLKYFTPTRPGVRNNNWVTLNSALSGTSGSPPTNWGVTTQTGQTLVSQTLTPAPQGGNYWDLTMIDGGTSTPGLEISNDSANLIDPVGKIMEACFVVEVLSGAVTKLTVSGGSFGGNGTTYPLQMSGGGYTAVNDKYASFITPASGPIVIKGHPFTGSVGTEYVGVTLAVNTTPGSNTTIRIHPYSNGIRVFDPIS